MSMIERKTSFQPTGRAGWPICLLPNWRGGAAFVRNWWHKDALLACDFRDGRFMRGGTELTAAYLFTTTRASGISLPDNADILQTLGINTLPQTTRGLFPNDQVTNSIRAPLPLPHKDYRERDKCLSWAAWLFLCFDSRR